MARVLDVVLESPGEGHTVESLASVAGMSRSAFSRRFQECFGQTPMNYVRDVRLRRAARLLIRGDLSVDGVASKVGFSSRSHFSRLFRGHFGRSPVEFRRGAEAH